MLCLKLLNKIQRLTYDELVEIYNIWLQDGEKFTEQDLQLHIANMILTYRRMCCYKHSCKEKYEFLIKEINHRASL